MGGSLGRWVITCWPRPPSTRKRRCYHSSIPCSSLRRKRTFYLSSLTTRYCVPGTSSQRIRISIPSSQFLPVKSPPTPPPHSSPDPPWAWHPMTSRGAGCSLRRRAAATSITTTKAPSNLMPRHQNSKIRIASATPRSYVITSGTAWARRLSLSWVDLGVRATRLFKTRNIQWISKLYFRTKNCKWGNREGGSWLVELNLLIHLFTNFTRMLLTFTGMTTPTIFRVRRCMKRDMCRFSYSRIWLANWMLIIVGMWLEVIDCCGSRRTIHPMAIKISIHSHLKTIQSIQPSLPSK